MTSFSEEGAAAPGPAAEGGIAGPDPLLAERMTQFREALRLLGSAGGDGRREAAGRLCELSRRIMVLAVPVAELAPGEGEAIVHMFREAGCQVGEAQDEQLAGYRENILTRADQLQRRLDQSPPQREDSAPSRGGRDR